MLKIYVVKRTDNNIFVGEPIRVVVVAKNEDNAKRYSPGMYPNELSKIEWMDNLSVTLIGAAEPNVKPGIQLTEYLLHSK